MSFTVTYRVKEFFFDRLAVIARVNRVKLRVLRKAGALVRQSARRILRRRKRVSRPGEPPSVHSTDKVTNLKNILYAFDGRDSVVIGPVGLNQMVERSLALARTTVPAVLEFGDSIVLKEWRFKNLDAMKAWDGWSRFPTTRKFDRRWRRQDRRWENAARHRGRHRLSDLGVESRWRRAMIGARPFMKPAFERERWKFPQLWANSIVA